ncbi:hypothetical protein PVK06_008591 [Gossypium arboreum]|uniref:Uncharacterized protein n=1 Tax=Gossypium arboreum TaxID=29729 RepID=A0ABR0QKB8_GOSAR|nr:hypothetical protein PVK06_008591 [Gossypium arboreum]
MLQVSDMTEKKTLFAFQEGLKPWVRQEVEQRGFQKLSEAMTVAEFVVKLGLGKGKLGSSKSNVRGVCEGNHKEDKDDSNGNNDSGGNGKPRVGKKKPKKKRDKLKFFLYDGPHMLKKFLKKSTLKKKSVDKALGLGSSARGVEAKEAKSEKKPLEERWSRQGAQEAWFEQGKSRTQEGKEKQKKRVKCFLYRGLQELRNCSKQAVVKEKATSKHGESSEGLLTKEVVSL